ncbi:MAG: DUF3703 domain-containing protein [Gammaproteobacteria bacterium]|nr:DUF3703 domain-containing protein [Gammaproteobacteria bacterium]MBU1444615.1 DUF3703 domain-containing protein [Gammaproteobacteria bacterium]MBU2154476.1 DUF3703 domain-containing protein [Gammaproteobacteria bacterium]MBU2215927.1 DUF3703 domain-containing protein [Gammaproteobacteria bacterium]
MQGSFSVRVTPYVESELASAAQARSAGDKQLEFIHLERAHVIGQESTYWHVKVHVLMLLWAVRNHSVQEAIGQLFRIVGAATKTAFGLVPQGNTGGANVSPFRKMPIAPDLADLVQKAKSDV